MLVVTVMIRSSLIFLLVFVGRVAACCPEEEVAVVETQACCCVGASDCGEPGDELVFDTLCACAAAPAGAVVPECPMTLAPGAFYLPAPAPPLLPEILARARDEKPVSAVPMFHDPPDLRRLQVFRL
ncbi:MAG: hypothetical protein ACQKBY_02440 [Verrucomicrobiales bacterium]